MFDTCHKKLRRLANDAKSWQEKRGRQLLVGEVCVRGAQTSESCVFPKPCRKYHLNCSLFLLIPFCSHATFCTPCAKAKAACKPFDADRARAKAKTEMARRSNAKKAKQQTDTEWKVEILRKLDSLRQDIQRIAVALEKLAGMEGEDSDEEQILWPESEGELTEVQGSKDKQKEERIDRAEEEEEVGGQEEENGIEGVEEGGNFSPVAYSVRTGVL